MNQPSTKQLLADFLARYSTNTRLAYQYDFQALADALGTDVCSALAQLVGEDLTGRQRLLHQYLAVFKGRSIATTRRRFHAVRSFVCYACKHRDVKVGPLEPYRELHSTASRSDFGPSRERAALLPHKQIDRMRVAIANDETVAGRRDLALLDLIFFHALTLSDLARLETRDVSLKQRAIRLRRPSSRRRHNLRLCEKSAASMEAWLECRPHRSADLVFLTPSNRVMSYSFLNSLLKRRAVEAGVQGRISAKRIIRARPERHFITRAFLEALAAKTR